MTKREDLRRGNWVDAERITIVDVIFRQFGGFWAFCGKFESGASIRRAAHCGRAVLRLDR